MDLNETDNSQKASKKFELVKETKLFKKFIEKEKERKLHENYKKYVQDQKPHSARDKPVTKVAPRPNTSRNKVELTDRSYFTYNISPQYRPLPSYYSPGPPVRNNVAVKKENDEYKELVVILKKELAAIKQDKKTAEIERKAKSEFDLQAKYEALRQDLANTTKKHDEELRAKTKEHEKVEESLKKQIISLTGTVKLKDTVIDELKDTIQSLEHDNDSLRKEIMYYILYVIKSHSKKDEEIAKIAESSARQIHAFKKQLEELSENLTRVEKDKDNIDNLYFLTKTKLVFLLTILLNPSKDTQMKMNKQLRSEINTLKEHFSSREDIGYKGLIYQSLRQKPLPHELSGYDTNHQIPTKSRNYPPQRQHKTADHPHNLQEDEKLENKYRSKQEVDSKITQLQLEKGRLENEYDKLMDKGPKTTAQRKLKSELELEIANFTKEITTLKRGQRQMK